MRVFDLSQFVYPEMSQISFMPPTKIEVVKQMPHIQQLTIATHVGTHIDAPFHFFAEGATIDQIPTDKLVGEGVILDIAKESQQIVRAEDLDESKPEARQGDFVLLRTGWGTKFGQEDYSRHPYLDRSAAEWLLDRKVPVFGIDTVTPELPEKLRPPNFDFPIHHMLLAKGTLIIENLNLKAIAGVRARIIALPLKIRGGDGAPARVVAVTED